MSAKQLLPEQCDFLHERYPPPECCICSLKAELAEAQGKLEAANRLLDRLAKALRRSE